MTNPGNESATHRKWRCPNCDAETWVPTDALGSQHDHSQRVFCGCDVAGMRMVPVNGPSGRVAL